MAVDDRNPDDDGDGGFDSVWVLVPLAALMIPIIAVSDGISGGAFIPIAIAVSMVLLVAGLIARWLMAQRHTLRMKELRVERDIANAEARQLSEANQVIDRNRTIEELRQAVADGDATAAARRQPDRPAATTDRQTH